MYKIWGIFTCFKRQTVHISMRSKEMEQQEDTKFCVTNLQ